MPKFSERLKDEIRAKVRVSEIASRKVKLKRAGKEWAALSPFTSEKTPSFFVNDAKQIFKCFSSGKGGDVFALFMEFENCSFPEAVERLAEMAGVEIPRYNEEDRQRDQKRKTVLEALSAAQDFFAKSLRANAEAKKYLEDRRIDPETISEWGIGFAPSGAGAIPNALKDFPKDVLIDAGLVRENSRGAYGFYRGRITFPIRDRQGRVVSFGARSIRPDQTPKYLNGGDTEVFHKSNTLFGIDTARVAIGDDRKANGFVLAEGYLDVIAFARAGVRYAVAPLGTSVTEQHLDELWRWGPEPIVCLDGDAAGQKAAVRISKLALPKINSGMTVSFVRLPEGKDPDDIVRDRGPAALRNLVRSPIPMPRMIWEFERDQGPLDTPERRTGFRARLNEYVELIKDRETARHYKNAFFEWTRDFYRRGEKSVAKSLDSGNVIGHRGLGVLVACIDNPYLIADFIEDLAEAQWSPECQTIYERVVDMESDGIEIDRNVVVETLMIEMKETAAEMVLRYPAGDPVVRQSAQWERIRRSIFQLRFGNEKPKTIEDAIRLANDRREMTKK